MQNPKKIVRFISAADFSRILDEKSFSLGSLKYYKNLEINWNDCTRGDKEECVVNRNSCDDNILVSCWSECDELEELPGLCKAAQPQGNDLAIGIISSVDQVCNFLTCSRNFILDKLPDNCKYLISKPEHRKVLYYPESANISLPGKEIFNAWSYKRKYFENQREYRFAFCGGWNAIYPHEGPLIFRNPDLLQIINAVWLSPRLNPQEKDNLRRKVYNVGIKEILQEKIK